MQSPGIVFFIKSRKVIIYLTVLLISSEICILAGVNFLQLRHKMSVTELYLLTFSNTAGKHGCRIMIETSELTRGNDVFLLSHKSQLLNCTYLCFSDPDRVVG